MGNSLTITVGGKAAGRLGNSLGNSLLANSVKRAAKLGRSLAANGLLVSAGAWVASRLF